MVAYHIMNGIAVPLDATDFYKGLDERSLKRDGCISLLIRVNEYDTARILNVEPIQFELLLPMRSLLLPGFTNSLKHRKHMPNPAEVYAGNKARDKFEERPELAVLLEENFLQDDKGRWNPDITKADGPASRKEIAQRI